jgi:hypothetical protein
MAAGKSTVVGLLKHEWKGAVVIEADAFKVRICQPTLGCRRCGRCARSVHRWVLCTQGSSSMTGSCCRRADARSDLPAAQHR